jgi:hypothetical protein
MGNNEIPIRIVDFKLEGSRGVGRPKHVGGWMVWWKIWESENDGGRQGWTVLVECARGSRGSLLVLLLIIMKNYEAAHYVIFSYLL